MTSQIENLSVEELKAEAKALNVAGWQACKDPEKLMQKIEEAKESGGRRVAPKFAATTHGSETREGMLLKLERENPGLKYMTQSSKLTPSQAQAKGIEIAKKPNGDILYCGEDIVCFTDKQSYSEWQNNRNLKSLKAMRSIDKDLRPERGGKKIQALTENVRTGFELEDS